MAGALLGQMLWSDPNTVSVPSDAEMRFTTPLGQVGFQVGGIGEVEGGEHRFSAEEMGEAIGQIQDIQKFDSAINNIMMQIAAEDPNFDIDQARAFLTTQQAGTKYHLRPTEGEYGASLNQRYEDYLRTIPQLRQFAEENGLDAGSMIDQYSSWTPYTPGANEAYWVDRNGDTLGVGASTQGSFWYTPEQTIEQGEDAYHAFMDPLSGDNFQTMILQQEYPEVFEALEGAANAPEPGTLSSAELYMFAQNPELINIMYG